MGMLNPFTLTVWFTPLLVGVVLGQRLRWPMPRWVRLALWVIYFVWGWRWLVIWYDITSAGSGRYAVEQTIFNWGVMATTALGWIFMVLGAAARLKERPNS